MRRHLSTLIGCSILGLAVVGCAHHHHHHGDHLAMAMNDLPDAVQSNFRRDHPGAIVKQIDKENDGTAIKYEIKYEDKDGELHEVQYDPEGDLIKDREEDK